MHPFEKQQYATLVNKILDTGEKRKSRAGDVYSIFGETMTIDMSAQFPLLCGRRMFYKPVLGELAAMLRGPKNIADFKQYGCNYWDAWGEQKDSCLHDSELAKGGELELDYGNAWLNFNGVNQLETVIKTLKTNPTDRRMLISGWRPDRLAELSLPCCHLLYQWYVRDGGYLDMVWYQRSVDVMVGLPSDIILCAAWNAIMAKQTGYVPGKLIFMLGDCHVYANHITPTVDYLRNLNKRCVSTLSYKLDDTATVENFIPDMLQIHNYSAVETIKFELNV